MAALFKMHSIYFTEMEILGNGVLSQQPHWYFVRKKLTSCQTTRRLYLILEFFTSKNTKLSTEVYEQLLPIVI